MARTQLNIDCEPEELRLWKRSALDEGKTLSIWVRERLGGDRGVIQKTVFTPKPRPTLDQKKSKALDLLAKERGLSLNCPKSLSK